jgi:glucose-1-phosphate thymidylyltransferase
MRAIIPVAGLGTRLRPHTHTLPKVLVQVGGKPILGHIIDKLLSEGITKATFVYGYLGELVIKYVTEEYPLLQADFIEQRVTEGLGHAIYLAIPTFDEDELFIILGDTIFDVNLGGLFEKKEPALGVKYVEDPRRFGVAMVAQHKITKLIEKPSEPVSHLALVGLYYITNKELLKQCLEKVVREDIRTRGELQFTDALQLMIDNGEQFNPFPVDGWYDCGKPETLLETNRHILKQMAQTNAREGMIAIPPVFIDETAVITNSIIGPYASIGKNAIVQNAIVEDSIIGSNASLKQVILKDSIIGNNAVITGSYKKLNTGDSSEIEFY